ncbi:protein S100-A13 [Apteryx rowi]|uniref:protein S100-A13 n=1 Tax=Apteryx rowi TaxID=308060 RepID=UPI000E1CFD5E|nr:protein S100-A13 [Apteryx rowi]
MAAAELTEVERAIEKIVAVFLSHAAERGRAGALTAAGFEELLRLELPNLAKDAPSLNARMRELHGSGDGELQFGEYWRLLGEVARSIRRDGAGSRT